jgi:ankyrin repeat protein
MEVHEAVIAGDLARLKALVAAGHSINVPDDVPGRLLLSSAPGDGIYEADEGGSLPLDLALAGQNPGVLDFLLEHGAQNTLFVGTLSLWALSHWTPEMLAVMVKYCHLDLPADLPQTALHDAVEGGSATAIRMLLARGADPKLKNRSGQTPLELAVKRKESECVLALSGIQ